MMSIYPFEGLFTVVFAVITFDDAEVPLACLPLKALAQAFTFLLDSGLCLDSEFVISSFLQVDQEGQPLGLLVRHKSALLVRLPVLPEFVVISN